MRQLMTASQLYPISVKLGLDGSHLPQLLFAGMGS